MAPSFRMASLMDSQSGLCMDSLDTGTTRSDRQPAHIDACFDTNVVLEISTIVDLNHAASTNALLAPSVFSYRRTRARASLAAAWLCQTKHLITFSLRHEVEHLLRRLAPNRTPDGDHAWFFAWFLKDYVLPDWNFSTSEDPAISDATMGGNARDRHLVSLAAEHRVPLVSNEVRQGGAIARAAATLQVLVMTPVAWISSLHAALDTLAMELLDRVRECMLVFIIDRRAFDRASLENCQAYVQVLELILDTGQQPILPDPLGGWRF
jgi:hypothetical protein